MVGSSQHHGKRPCPRAARRAPTLVTELAHRISHRGLSRSDHRELAILSLGIVRLIFFKIAAFSPRFGRRRGRVAYLIEHKCSLLLLLLLLFGIAFRRRPN